jgi:hypothetical protein
MDKKTKTIVIVIIAVVAVGGLYYGFNRYRQQRLAQKMINSIYGNGVLSGDVANQIAKGLAEQAVQDKADEAKEAAKTPEDKYNDATEAVSASGVSTILNSEVKPKVEAVFGKAKLVAYSNGFMGGTGSFFASFKTPRIVTSADLGQLVKKFTDDGYTITYDTAEGDSANVMLQKDGAYITCGYENGGESQEISISYIPAPTAE